MGGEKTVEGALEDRLIYEGLESLVGIAGDAVTGMPASFGVSRIN